jgi:alpha-tubulin suppressor-like RCC1 family protein
VLTGGNLKCWGSNAYGQLGDGTTMSSSVPVSVGGLPANAVAVSVGLGFTCAVLTTGGVLCWGWGAYGQLGDGTTSNSFTPVQVSGLVSNGVAVSSGRYHTCAVTTTGAKCWGNRNLVSLGDGVAGGFSATPVSPVALNDAPGTPTVINVTATNSAGAVITSVTLTVS